MKGVREMTVLELWNKTTGLMVIENTDEEVNSGVALAHKDDEVLEIKVSHRYEKEFNVPVSCLYITI